MLEARGFPPWLAMPASKTALGKEDAALPPEWYPATTLVQAPAGLRPFVRGSWSIIRLD